ncbi:MAG: GNAT family N-acetyltransferase [Methylobacteriaceae bacterium]|nr:GNAT family N-acetyltransferase [Methylobacteriaceae bacterium]
MSEVHREGLREAAADVSIFRYMIWPGDFDRWFDEAMAETDQVPFAVVLAGVPVGSTRYLAYAPEHRRVEIGWTWNRRSAWGTGANVEAKYLLMRHAFETHRLQRVEFKTDARNQQTRGALLAAGCRFEGIARKHMLLPSGPRDSAWYAVTEDDWPEVKVRLEDRIRAKAA